MKTYFVSIITLNYNGKGYLKSFLESALDLNYPKNAYEIIVVDNASTDGSVDYLKKNFSKVRIVKSKKNLGFGRGNNLGMKHAKGDLFFLVNNDTFLHRDSVKNIVKTFNKWNKKEKIGAVNAKLVLVDAYLPLLIEEAFFSNYKVQNQAQPVNKQSFVIPHESSKLFSEKVFIPINHRFNSDLKIKIDIKPFRRNKFNRGNLKKLGNKFDINFEISRLSLKESKVNLIQNAGNFYFRDGFGRDRGAIVYKHKQFYEVDKGQYDNEEAIPGFCGAGVLINKKALEEIGYFDDDFFMYYEDAELSFRMRENGWNIVYSPDSVVRHIHAGSSKEWSPFFTYNVERGRLLFVAKHWPRLIAIKEWLKYVLKDTIGIPLYYLIHKNKKAAFERISTRAKVNASLLLPFLVGLFRTKRLSRKELKTFM